MSEQADEPFARAWHASVVRYYGVEREHDALETTWGENVLAPWDEHSPRMRAEMMALGRCFRLAYEEITNARWPSEQRDLRLAEQPSPGMRVVLNDDPGP